MMGVRLNLYRTSRPPEDPAEHAQLLQILNISAQAAHDLDQEDLLRSALDPLQIRVGAGDDEAIPVNNAPQVLLAVAVSAGAGSTAPKPHAFQLFGQEGLPASRGILCAVQTPVETGTHAWHSLLRPQRDENAAHGQRV